MHLDGRPQTVYVDPHDDVVGQPFRRGAHWEAWLHGYFRQYANASEVAVDVGANMGAHTIVLARLFREVHSFEMQKRVMRLLRENVDYLFERFEAQDARSGLVELDSLMSALRGTHTLLAQLFPVDAWAKLYREMNEATSLPSISVWCTMNRVATSIITLPYDISPLSSLP